MIEKLKELAMIAFFILMTGICIYSGYLAWMGVEV